MTCDDCPRFDAETRKCRDGKINPQRWSEAVEVSQILGIRVICSFNDHRERLVNNRGGGKLPTKKNRL